MAYYFEFNNISYNVNNQNILNNISFKIKNKGDVVSILGPSGIGKTTILRCIAGLRNFENGSIFLKNRILHDEKININPEERNIALSFQDNALFPHYTVEENIQFGIKKSLFCSKNKNGPLGYSMDQLL